MVLLGQGVVNLDTKKFVDSNLLNSVTVQGEVKWWKISLTTRVE